MANGLTEFVVSLIADGLNGVIGALMALGARLERMIGHNGGRHCKICIGNFTAFGMHGLSQLAMASPPAKGSSIDCHNGVRRPRTLGLIPPVTIKTNPHAALERHKIPPSLLKPPALRFFKVGMH